MIIIIIIIIIMIMIIKIIIIIIIILQHRTEDTHWRERISFQVGTTSMCTSVCLCVRLSECLSVCLSQRKVSVRTFRYCRQRVLVPPFHQNAHSVSVTRDSLSPHFFTSVRKCIQRLLVHPFFFCRYRLLVPPFYFSLLVQLEIFSLLV